MRRAHVLILIVLLASISIASCGPSSGMSLDDTAWELTTIGGLPLVAGSTITLAFEGGEIDGNAGCNHYFGSYSLNSVGGFQPGAIAMTEMACLDTEGVMQQELVYLEYLGSAVKAVRIGNQLKLQDASGEDILVFTGVFD
jgi:heat shock protein HslJ